jgi:hypothetical protein
MSQIDSSSLASSSIWSNIASACRTVATTKVIDPDLTWYGMVRR